MDNFVGCTLTPALLVAAAVVWCGLIYASNLLGAAIFN